VQVARQVDVVLAVPMIKVIRQDVKVKEVADATK
jgi:hypothetical protein